MNDTGAANGRLHPLMGLRPGNHSALCKSAGDPVAPWTPGEPAPVTRGCDEWAVINGVELLPEVATVFQTEEKTASPLRFMVNGEQQVVQPGDVPVGTSLAEYLRYHVGLIGTKIACGEGGCGACTVVLKDSDGNNIRVANACLRPLWSMDGFEVLTTEGLGSTTKGLHKVQETLAECNGSQCGMCTPGMVMAIYGCLNKAKTPKGAEAEFCIQGNLCRCTGYRPIYHAVQKLFTDPPETDKTASSPRVTIPRRFAVQDGSSLWLNCDKLEDIFVALKAYGNRPHRLVVGNTSTGVVKYYPQHANDNPMVYINIARVADLRAISVDGSSATFGAAVTLSEVIDHLDTLSDRIPGFQKVVEHLRLVAHPQVRDVASWAGNIMIAKTHTDFPSDVALLFVLLKSTLTLSDGVKEQSVGVSKFLAGAELSSSTIITKVQIPFPAKEDIVNSFKVMRRHFNTHAEVNAGFQFSFKPDSQIISDLRIVFGNIDLRPFLCEKTASSVLNKELSMATLEVALQTLSEEVVVKAPSVSDPPFVVVDVKYRKELALSLFYKAWLGAMVSRLGKEKVDAKLLSAVNGFLRPLSGGAQSYTIDPANVPVGQPIPKVEAPKQASGEMQFIADYAWPARTCVGHMVLAEKVAAISSIDASVALTMDGVVGFISADTVKNLGANNVVHGTAYEIFAAGKTKHVGQFVGMVCATTFAAAAAGAATVVVTYNQTEDASKAVLSAKEARACPENLKMGSHIIFNKDAKNSATSTASLTAKGEISTSGQKHFYMETQTTFAVPDSSGGLVVNTSTQQLAGGALNGTQTMLAKTLKLTESKIVVQTGFIGGAYGGKVYLYAPVAAAACIAALSLKRPVLLQLDRNSDMLSLGGRPPMDANWTVGFDSSGKISSVDQQVTVDCGFDKSGFPMDGTSANIYDFGFWSGKFSTDHAVTAKPLNTIMRAPGEFQGCLFIEALVEQVARELKVEPVVVQEKNMGAGVKSVWAKMKDSAKYDTRRKEADDFNSANRWRKRGVYMMGTDYKLMKTEFYTGYSEKCLVRVEADGIVTLDHSGLEMGQGINTKACQAATKVLAAIASDFIISDVRTLEPKSTSRFSWTLVTPTFGSATSEAVVVAVTNACASLSGKLQKYKGSWKEIVAAALKDGVDLSASGSHSRFDGMLGYHIYVAACVCTEIDVLTGETEVLSADIVHDAGKSLNPAVDIGQIEGCFVQALGFCLTEQQSFSKTDGRLINCGTWDYKVPSGRDIPIEMNVTLLNSTNTSNGNVFGSKSTGEPAYCIGSATFFAVKDAILAARKDAGVEGYFRLDCPASPEAVQQACLVQL